MQSSAIGEQTSQDDVLGKEKIYKTTENIHKSMLGIHTDSEGRKFIYTGPELRHYWKPSNAISVQVPIQYL